MSDRKPPTPLSPSTVASSAPKSRQGSIASASFISPEIDREQLSQALDKIHNSAKERDSLTTFNDIAPPPDLAASNESKGLASDIVQNGLSGLYSRFKEAVGVSGKDKSTAASSATTKERTDPNDGDTASRKSSSTTATASKISTSLLRTDTAITSSTLNSNLSDPMASTISSSGIALTNESQSQQPQSTMASSVTNIAGVATSKSASSSRQSIPNMTKATATVAPAHVSAFKETPRGTSTKTEDGSSRGNPRRSSTKANEGQPTIPVSEMSTIHDMPGTKRVPTLDKINIPTHNRREGGLSIDGNIDSPTSPIKRPSVVASISTASNATSSDSYVLSQSTRPSVKDTVKRPALLDRISYSRHRSDLSRSSSLSRGTTEHSPISTSAHNSVHHESFTQAPQPQRIRSGEYRIPGTTTDEGAPEIVNAKLASMRKQVLSKDFWMADETCKECFLCGAPFTAFRRKHHCRTCGCIFDSGCTSIIGGQRFGVQGTLRVCNPCLSIIVQRQDGTLSDDDSADDSFLPAIFRSTQSKRGYSPFSKADRDDASFSERTEDFDEDNRSLTAPMMAIPAARRIGESSNRNSAVLEIDVPQLSRPSSSRSLKSGTPGRPQSSGHRRHHSKHNLWNRLKASPEQRAPFRKSAKEEAGRKSGLHAFHDDNVIDPDLAPFMSDESSGDEQMSIAGVMAGSDLYPPTDSERSSFGAYLNAGRKLRSRGQMEKSTSAVSFTSRGLDDFHPRSSRRRNLSIASGNHLRSPRPKSSALRGPTGSSETLPLFDSPGGPELPRLTRSSSMKGDKEPRLELNPASLLHVRKLLQQLLHDSDIPNVAAWEKALVPVLLKCTSSVDPDIDSGDDIDIRHYVKLKKIPGGRPSDTCYVPGVIFTKKLALKSMPRRMPNPRVVIVSFPIEYQRHQQQFMSLQPVIEQEREFLKQLVNRITALRPHLLLAEKSVSGLALQFLSDAKISVVYNVKPSVLSAVSRCLGTEIISSVDMLALPPHQFQTGKSTSYEVKTFVNEEIPGRKKTYIFLSSNQEELGCTIALRGASTNVLSKLKRITEFMVYVVYNLKLESCLIRDSYIQLPTGEDMSRDPSQPAEGSMISFGTRTSALDDDGQRSLRTSNQDEIPPSQEDPPLDKTVEAPPSDITPQDQPPSQPNDRVVSLHESHPRSVHDSPIPDDTPMPTFYSDMVAKYETKILSASPFVKFAQPYLLMKAREQERKLLHLKRLRDHDVVDERADGEKPNQKFQLIKPRMVLETGHKAPRQMMEILHAVHDAEYDKAFYNYQTQTRQWENYIQSNIGLFEPYAHQNIVVLHSVICTETKIPCLEPTLFAFGFYDEHVDGNSGMAPDCTLGQYIEDICYSADTNCTSNGCDRKMYEHHRTYVHGEARITIFIEQDTRGRLGGENIVMWSFCKLCKRETSQMEMSKGTWKYSFGKYLELSFWSRGTHLVKDDNADGWNCPHDHHRDHIRYFGLQDKIVRVHYDPIDLLEIIVPRARITWNVEHDLNMKNEIFSNAQERWTRFTTSVKARLKVINTDNILSEKAEACKGEVERLSKKIQDDHTLLIRKLQDKYMASKYYEVIPFNVVLRDMLVKVAEWDTAFTKFEADFLPSDKDIRRLTMIHLRKMFTDESKESNNEATDNTEESTQASAPDTDSRLDTQPSEPVSDSPPLDTIQEKSPLDVPPQEETLERVEPLDLATPKSPVSTASLPSQPENKVAIPQASPPLNAIRTPALSPDLAPVPTLTSAPPMSLTEQVKQIRHRQQSLSLENAGVGSIQGNEQSKTERGSSRRMGMNVSPPMVRALSHPVNSVPTLPRMHSTMVGKKMFGANKEKDRVPSTEAPTGNELRKSSTSESSKGEKKLFSSLRPHRKGNSSSIPRFVGKKDSRVSTIRKHFEQLSREFEKEREKDREKRKQKMSHSRPFLQNSPAKAIVEVYEDVDEAVQESGPVEDELAAAAGVVDAKRNDSTESARPSVEAKLERGHQQSPKDDLNHADDVMTECETDDQTHTASLGATDDEQGDSDTEHSLIDGTTLEEIAESFDSSTDIPIELPKQDKNNFMKVLTTFWNERSASQWPPLEYPLNATDHIFWDSDIIIREDEPSSLIAFALSSEDYKEKLRTFYEKSSKNDAASTEAEDDARSEMPSDIGDNITEEQLETKLVHTTSCHYKYQFTEGTARMFVKILYAEQFDALRRKCGVADRIVESLSRCLKWDSKGGKTKSVFLKTQDDRLVMKSLSPVETAAFLKFAPAYFSLMAEALFHDLPSVIAKMLGFFQVSIRNPVTNTEIKLDLLLMENLFYDRAPTRIFDLKGSMRNRKIQSTGEQNEVLLDENMVEYIYESPLFAREHSKKLLRVSVWNDTLFLARQNVMDYSLMIAVDEAKKELVVGIIDCIRTYTWDKKLESWIKDRGFAGGGRNRPTVTSPKEYKSRFREAMARYILEAPNCWHQFNLPMLGSSSRTRAEINAAAADETTATDAGAA
ncbi:uncharacterized protein GGS22DRAFT_49737 [Annulohypoxylon maeteangense]|uniref:uncharacterized protein n=1 Tax=Annulohypoxylon maeteangense TaxID=1927788 RepID=UPI0020082516|nr:uncharacterized protein GGS22DRAFT_49737 [Annulohypoxylon maeteangense]KAI0882262.1 hypothetical protein GGS22DRAFT_49737 [Annulohypoxylon maeteangense]